MEELLLLAMEERSSSMSRQVSNLFVVSITFYSFLLDYVEVLFKFEDYQHKDDKENQTTNVERGVLEKIFFDVIDI